MIKIIKTLEEAQKYKYGKWAGNPNGNKYVGGRCAYEVQDLISNRFYQCLRKNGHGINGLYCKQHAKMIDKLFGNQ